MPYTLKHKQNFVLQVESCTPCQQDSFFFPVDTKYVRQAKQSNFCLLIYGKWQVPLMPYVINLSFLPPCMLCNVRLSLSTPYIVRGYFFDIDYTRCNTSRWSWRCQAQISSLPALAKRSMVESKSMPLNMFPRTVLVEIGKLLVILSDISM